MIHHDDLAPSLWVDRWLDGVKPRGSVLDIACGGGRHMRLALARGHRVTGVDRDLSRVRDLNGNKDVELMEADLESGGAFPPQGRLFDGVIVANYLWRPILRDIIRCVADDGVLIYETFGRGQERYGKPSNPDFLLVGNELLDAVSRFLLILAFEQGKVEGRRPRIVHRIAACGPAHRWAQDAPPSVGP